MLTEPIHNDGKAILTQRLSVSITVFILLSRLPAGWSAQLPLSERRDESPVPPGKVLDLSNWKLTLPVDLELKGKPTEIRAAKLQTFSRAELFYVDRKRNAVIFRAACGGVPTKGSSYPRCELREMTAGGSKPAAWGTADGSLHVLTIRCAILKTPPVKRHVVCAQIHDADDDVLMIRLEGKKLFIERNKLGDVMLDRNYKLGTPIDLKIQAGGGRIKVWMHGKLKMNWKTGRTRCYFKAGCYTQSNLKKGDAASSFGEVAVYRLWVKHRTVR